MKGASPNEFALEAAIVRIAARYRIVFPEIIRRVLFKDVPAEDGLAKAEESLMKLTRKRARKAPALNCHKFPDGKLKFFTVHGATPSADTLEYDLAACFFCLGTDTRRYRLEYREVKELFKDAAPHHHIRHAASRLDIPGGPTVFRLYPTTTTVKSTVSHLKKKHISNSQKAHPGWVSSGDYAFAVLADSDAKRDDIKAEVSRPVPGRKPLSYSANILVQTVPTIRTISDWEF